MIEINISEATKTWKIENNRLSGFCDNVEALKQAVYLILSIEKNKYLIYGQNYGTEIHDLYGMPKNYVYPELERRIKESLIEDDRIKDVDNFKFEYIKNGIVLIKFTVHSIYKKIEINKEIVINA